MKVIDAKKVFADYTATQVKGIKNKPFSLRKISVYEDVLAAFNDVYCSGIIFPRRGRLAKRNNTPNVEIILSTLAKKVYNYFSIKENGGISKEEFDLFHNELCTTFLDAINVARQSVGYMSLNYGNAQKLINIVFKYLACYSDYICYVKHFIWCHMPIDTIILKWLKDNYNIREIRYSIYDDTLSASYKKKSWTSLDKIKYEELVNIIRNNVLADIRFPGLSVLDVEFVVWGE